MGVLFYGKKGENTSSSYFFFVVVVISSDNSVSLCGIGIFTD